MATVLRFPGAVESPTEFTGRLRVIGSTGRVMRSGRRIDPAGWQLAEFRKNPVVLFEHEHLVGTADVQMTGDGLLFDIQLAEDGTSAIVDTCRSFVRQGLLNTASVGWIPIEYKDRRDGVFETTKAELVEISLVSIPDNPECIRIASLYGTESVMQEASHRARFARDVQTRHAMRLREIEILRLKCPRMGAPFETQFTEHLTS